MDTLTTGPPPWPQLNTTGPGSPRPLTVYHWQRTGLIIAMSRLTLYLGHFALTGSPTQQSSPSLSHLLAQSPMLCYPDQSPAKLSTKESGRARTALVLEHTPNSVEALRPLGVKQTSGLGPGCFNVSMSSHLVRVQSLVQVDVWLQVRRWGE